MPIIIRELIIRANVADNPAGGTQSSAPGNNAANNSNDRQAIISACVEQVLEILEKKKER